MTCQINILKVVCTLEVLNDIYTICHDVQNNIYISEFKHALGVQLQDFKIYYSLHVSRFENRYTSNTVAFL